MYRGVAICSPNKGDTISFWWDLIQGSLNHLNFPNLLSFAKDDTISLQKIAKAEDLLSNFNLPMTRQAYNEFILLNDTLADMRSGQSDINDVWSYIWIFGKGKLTWHLSFTSIILSQ